MLPGIVKIDGFIWTPTLDGDELMMWCEYWDDMFCIFCILTWKVLDEEGDK